MGSSCPVTIIFTSKFKNCFINISPLLEREWNNVWKDDSIAKAIQLEYEGSSIYTSWSGSIQKSSQNRYAIEISRKLGECLGLKEGEEVLATPLNKVSSCSIVTFIPTTESDWEIIESNSKLIESDLINQIRIVWEGAILPIWINKNSCFLVTVGEIIPKSSCSQINEYTEVKIFPQGKKSSTSTKVVNERETSNNLNIDISSTAPSSSSDKSTDNSSFNPISGINYFSHTLGKSLYRVGDKYEQAYTPTYAPDLAAIQQLGLRAGVVNYFKGVVFGPNSAELDNGAKSRIYPSVVKARSREAKTADTIVARSNKSSSTLFSGFPSQSYYRVQDLVVLPNDVTTPRKTSGVSQVLPRELLEQPSTVLIYCDNLTWTVNRLLNDKVATHDGLPISKNYVVATASIHKMYSVKERNDMNSSSKRSDTGNNDISPNDETRESNPVKLFEQKRFESSVNSKLRNVSSGERSFSALPTTTVRLVMTTQKNIYADQDCKSRALLGEELLSGHIIVNGLLRRQLKLGVKSAVQIKKILHKPSTLMGVVLNPFGEDAKKAKSFSKKQIVDAFINWVVWITKDYPLILASRMLVSFNITSDVRCEFLLSGVGALNSSSNTRNTQQYYCVCEETLKTASVNVGDVIKPSYYLLLSPYPSKSTSLLDQDLPKCSLASLGGVDQIYQSCFDFLLLGLSCHPVSQQLSRCRNPSSNTLLIYGSGSTAGGAGKSSLALALCHQLGRHPVLAHVSIIDCICFRGKRVETIRKSWQQTFDNSAWHQPSVILFDDLDQLISAPSLLQEHGPEANYTLRLAEVFKGFLRKEVAHSSQLVVIATVTSRDSIHPSLLTSHGNHIFNKTIEIPLPGLNERASMIDCMLQKKEISLPSEDVRVIAVKTEGCSPKDLNTLVARAFQASTMRRNVFKQDSLSVSLQDFTEALRRFKPASLHGIKLHQGVDLGWRDVGGLEEIKRTLMETLEWPAKFPDLYANIPMRLPSGILLYGPPGTGKTLLAGVVAKECSLNFICINGPELLSKYIGASEQAVRDLFHRAQSAKPCILFFDEFDSMAPRRGHDSTGVTDRVVNQLLTQLDGVEGLVGVYILAATSRPDLIDPALLRPGRLDKSLYCGMPEEEDRFEILKALSRMLTLHDDVNFKEIARETLNFSGADLKALLCNAQLERIHKMKTTMSGQSDKPVRNSNILCMPQLQHGPQEPPDEENAELQKQVLVLEDNLFKSVSGKADHSPKPTLKHSMIIRQNDIMKALSNMGPSVSSEERIKYAAMYHSFMKSKKSADSPQKPIMKQRATLA